MSDVDFDEDDDNEMLAEEKEDEILVLRALLNSVKPCPALYAKSKKEYSGKNFNKDLAWASVGQAQIPPISGKDAKDAFYKVRQRFGKEWRKYLAHQKGKSGQGASAPFTSTWALFDDCRFLGDHITPRKTNSSYKSTATTPVVKTSQAKRSLLNTSSSSMSPCDITTSSLWNSDLQILTCTTSNPEESTAPSTPTGPTASEQVMKAMEKAVKSSKRIPEADNFATKRQRSDKEFMDTMVAQGNAQTKVACAFGKALEAPTPAAPPVLQPESCPVVVAIKYAMESVPEDQKLPCLTDVLHLISTKYTKK